MNIKLIATDLDNTLLNKQSQISSFTSRVMEEASKKGIIIVAVTGRPLWRANLVCAEERAIKYIISANGALIMDKDNNKVIKENYIINKYLNDVIRFINSFNYVYELSCITTKGEEISLINDIKRFQSPFKGKVKILEVKDMFEYVSKNGIKVCKINVILDDEKGMQSIRNNIGNIRGIQSTVGVKNVLEIVSDGVDKGKALSVLTDYLGLNLEETIAFGDNENDFTLLRTSGIAVAVKNAQKVLLNISDYVTTYDNDNDGVARFIQDKILKT